MIEKRINYNEYFSLCEEGYQRFGDILTLPIGLHPYAYIQKISSEMQSEQFKILDFGCGSLKPLQKILKLDKSKYLTCDDDMSGEFSYRHVDEIKSEDFFDIIASSHAFEHMTFKEGVDVGIKLTSHLKPGGTFFIAVPNPSHPTRYLSSPTHITPWNYLNLYALLRMNGLTPNYCARYHKHPRPPFYIYPLIYIICKYFMMDWADSIYVVGRKDS